MKSSSSKAGEGTGPVADSEEHQLDSQFITVARVVKTQGRWGEVAVDVHSDVPGRFAEGLELLALPKDAPNTLDAARRQVKVEGIWPHKEFLVLKFAGVDSISDAEQLIGAELQLPRSERGVLETGWNFVSDLVGCAIFDRDSEIGVVEDVTFGAGEAPLLVVANAAGQKFDVPFADAFLESIDVVRRIVRTKFPDGLLEVNAPLTAEEKAEQAGEQRKPDNKRSGGKNSENRNSRRIRSNRP